MPTPSQLIDKAIASLPDWRGQTLATVRRLVLAAEPNSVEEWKWMGTPTWSRDGILCACDAHKNVVKVLFFNGAALPDPDRLFNAELEGTTRRAIKFFEGDSINERAFAALIRASSTHNADKLSAKGGKAKAAPKPAAKAKAKTATKPAVKTKAKATAKPAAKSKAKATAKPAKPSKAKTKAGAAKGTPR